MKVILSFLMTFTGLANLHAQDWNVSIVNPKSRPIKAVSLSDKIIVSVGDLGMVRYTTNDGLSWSHSFIQGAPTLRATKILQNGNWVVGGDGLYRSTNHGGSWSSLLPSDFSLNALAFDGEFGAAVGNGGIVSVSQDYGSTWSRVTTFMESDTLLAVAVDGDTVLVAGKGGLVAFSTNRGLEWHKDTLSKTPTFRHVSLIGRWLIAGDGWAFYSYDTMSRSWERERIDSDYESQVPLASVQAFAVLSTGEAVVSLFDFLFLSGFVYSSTDFGRTWKEIKKSDLETNVSVFSHSERSLLYSSFNYIHRSDDFGNSWHIAFRGEGAQYRSGSASSAGMVLLGQALTRADYSTDEGQTWSEVTPKTQVLNPRSVTISSQGSIVIGSDSGALILSSDGGLIWRTEKLNTFSNVRLLKSSYGQIEALAGRGELYTSADQGKTWASLLQSSEFINDFVRVDARTFLAASSSNSVLRTTDGGATWMTLTVQGRPSLITFSDGQLWMAGISAGLGFIDVSRDSGATWSRTFEAPLPMGVSGLQFTDKLHGVLSGKEGKLLSTSDGGLVWSESQLVEANKMTLYAPSFSSPPKENFLFTQEGLVFRSKPSLGGAFKHDQKVINFVTPNPAERFLRLASESHALNSLRVSNALGTDLTLPIYEQGNAIQIDCATLPSGAYFIRDAETSEVLGKFLKIGK